VGDVCDACFAAGQQGLRDRLIQKAAQIRENADKLEANGAIVMPTLDDWNTYLAAYTQDAKQDIPDWRRKLDGDFKIIMLDDLLDFPPPNDPGCEPIVTNVPLVGEPDWDSIPKATSDEINDLLRSVNDHLDISPTGAQIVRQASESGKADHGDDDALDFLGDMDEPPANKSDPSEFVIFYNTLEERGECPMCHTRTYPVYGLDIGTRNLEPLCNRCPAEYAPPYIPFCKHITTPGTYRTTNHHAASGMMLGALLCLSNTRI
jgi:hypothetical protein